MKHYLFSKTASFMAKMPIALLLSILTISFTGCSTSQNSSSSIQVSHRSVVPSKHDGWEKHKVTNGITYWMFKGYDPVSKDSQIVNVADVDLNKGFKLKMFYSNGVPTTASLVQKEKNAWVTMNAGYETSSIFVKIDGKVLFDMKNDQIFKTGVPNWKNDGGICADNNGMAYICNALCSKVGENGKSQYGATLDQQRIYYKETLTGIENIISSGPLLIDNFNPVGLSFVPEMTKSEMQALRYEDPLRHQGVRHPRTAVAITENNHLLMFVVDGRRSNTCGFSAKELTNFLIKHFNPQYALNLDGGGSTTLCVDGYGDANTHVVNYPCDNGKFDHTGERKVATYLYIEK